MFARRSGEIKIEIYGTRDGVMSAVLARSGEDGNDTDTRIVTKEPGSAERGYRDNRRSLVEEGGAPKGVSSLSHFARQHEKPWRADWGEGGVTWRSGEVADRRTYSGAAER